MDTRTNNLQVKSYGSDSGDSACWNEFLSRNSEAHFYQQYEWKAVNEQEFGHRTYYLAVANAQEVVGILPLVLIKSHLFGRILCSMPFVNFGGVAVANEQADRVLIDHACQIAEQENAKYLEIRGLRPCAKPLPTAEHKISMMLKLASDPEELWNAFQSKHRTNIRRVYKDGVTIKSGQEDLLDAFYDVMAQSWSALGTPIYRKRYFETILDTFGDQIKIFVAYKDEIPVATACNGHFKSTVEGMWAGGVPEYRKLQANYVLYWEMIKDACEKGFHSFHLGRSTAGSGSEIFKKKWNAEPRQLYWQYFMPSGGDMPQLNVSNPKYKAAIAAWKKLPLWATRSFGPLLSKSIP